MNFVNALPGAINLGIIWGIMAIGVFITYKILDFADLTVDGSFVTGGAVCAILIISGINPVVALIIAFLAGTIAGLITSILHVYMGITPILAGILTQLGLWSINLKIMGKANIAVNGRQLNLIVKMLNVEKSMLVLVIIAIVFVAILYWFFGTVRGRTIRATGNNIAMSKAQGINTDVNKIIALMLSNGIVAFAGGLLCQYQGFADISMGQGAIVIGLASVIIGNTLVKKLASNFIIKLLSVVFGGIIYYIVFQFVVTLGLDTDLLKLLSAIVVAIFLAIPYWKKKYLSKEKLNILKEGLNKWLKLKIFTKFLTIKQ